jgi:DNA polymerase-1
MKILLIDGYSLLYRAFFSSPPFTTKAGEPTGALFGFSKMVLRLLDEMAPTHVLVAMDGGGPTFRHDTDATYKAGRAEMPSDLHIQTALVREMMTGLSIPFTEHAGFEADDILGTMSRIATERELEVTIVTGDGDALQLVDDRISVMLTRRGVSDLECYTPAAIQERFGFEAKLIPDYKGLRGDSSDNIAGVPGIGEKTAITLVSKYGSLDSLFERVEEVTPPRIRDLLIANREVALHSRVMATIVRDLPLDIELDACRYEIDDARRERAGETMRRFEFKSLAARYAAPTEAAPEAAPAPTEARDFETRVLDDEQVLASWLAVSGEPAALVFNEDDIALARGDEAIVWTGERQVLAPWISDPGARKYLHDAKNSILKLEAGGTPGLQVLGVAADTFLMSYLLEPTRQQHPLDGIARKYLRRELPTEPEVPKPKASSKAKPKVKKANASLFDQEPSEEEAAAQAKARADEEAAALAAAEERRAARRQVLAAQAVAVLDAVPVLRAEMEKSEAANLFDRIELPLVEVLVAIERAGMLLDREQLEAIGVRLQSESERLEKEIWELAGEKFTIGSTKQLQTILFDKLQLSKGRSNKTGFSTDVHTLEKLAEDHEIVRKILDYRGVTKLKSTYIDGLLAGMDGATNRIHSNLNQTGTVSGRLSSSNPNLQNVPIRTEQGRLIRRAFIAPPGHVIVAADYSQIELRLLAHITGDKTLVDAFNSGQDVHSRTAADLFHIPIESVDSDMRRKAKMTNYAIAYGVSGFGLAKQLGSGTAAEAQEFIRKYFETLPGVKKYIDDTLAQARVDGFVSTLLGRRRPLPEITSPRGPERAAAERTAINHPIQGTSADAMKLAMLAIHAALREAGLQTRMTMQVHDELVFEVPEAEVAEVAALAEQIMREVPTQALGLRVPLEVDVEAGPNWNETKGLEEEDHLLPSDVIAGS